jgi:uncharacterized membrane protein YgcG
MIKRKWSRITLSLGLLASILTSSLSGVAQATGVGAQPTTSTPATNMATSMLEFFRTERTELVPKSVNTDELMVYGIFMSNFFKPWETKLKDIKDDSTDTSVVKRITSKFFGADDKSATRATGVKGVNELLYKAVTDVLTSDAKTTFALYPTTARAEEAKTPVTGKEFLKKLSRSFTNESGNVDMLLYNSSKVPVMDLNDKGIQASIQVIFGISPDMFLRSSKDDDKTLETKGLQALTGMYMDGFGNIWGSYAPDGTTDGSKPNVPVEDYILFMPAVLNPVVYSDSYTKTQFPVANVFVLGGILKIKDTNFLKEVSYKTPYYNIATHFPVAQTATDDYNSTNLINIFGIQSPTPYVGNTDAIIAGEKNNPFDEVTKFLNVAYATKLDNVSAKILLSVNTEKISNIETLVGSNELKPEERKSLVGYLMATSSFGLNELADDMYYFNVNKPNLTSAQGDAEGDWNDESSFIVQQKLFTKETKETGKFQFYNNSVVASPFSTLLSEYNALKGKDDNETNAKKEQFLVTRVVNDKKIDTTKPVFRALKLFFDTGSFTYVAEDGKTYAYDDNSINGALKEMKDGGDNMVYNAAISSNLTSIVPLGRALDTFFIKKVTPVAYGLTANDYNLTFESAFANMSRFARAFASGSIPTVAPFEFSATGGELKGVTPENVGAISTYFHTTMTYNLFTTNKKFNELISGEPAGSKLKTPFGESTTKTAIMNGVNNYPGIYWGNMVRLLKIKPVKQPDNTIKLDKVSFRHSILPAMALGSTGGGLNLNAVLGSSGVVSSEDKTIEDMQKDIIRKVYGLLSDGPNNYRDKLIKSAQDSWIISTHRSITGSWIGNALSVSAGGNSSYASVVGYISTPSLHDLPLTSWILKDYMYVYLFLMLIILIILILMVISNIRRPGEGIAIFILMAFVLILPQFLLTNVINMSNSAGDKLYSGRFNYWAITQHEQALKTLNGARSGGNESDVIVAQSMQMAQNVYTSDAGVRVKWMSPKKNDTFDKMFNKNTTSESLIANLTLFRWLFNSYFNQEEYVYSDPMATYLYRPYNAIASEAKKSYETMSALATFPTKESAASSVSKLKTGVLNLPPYSFGKLLDTPTKLEFAKDQKDLVISAAVFPLSNDTEKVNSYRFWALNNTAVTTSIFRSDPTAKPQGLIDTGADASTDAFLLSTESPFYYFYNVFKSRYSDIGGNFNSALLSKELFKAVSTDKDVNNKLRDFMDMEGLFSYVVPYLHQSNDYVYAWTNVYGKSLDTFKFKGAVVPSGELGDKFAAERDKKEAMKQVWKMYTPWVDQMYSLDTQGKRVSIANKKLMVSDTLNPGAYEEVGRPMIFSEADMNAKSYQVSDLTDVELRIQATLNSTYKDLMYLSNYHDFDKETLLTAAAMMATFNFNREFSDTKILSTSTTLYPQNFELKNFNYDAFMRLLLLNATGEPLMAEKDLYARILDKTSIFTGLLLLMCDLMAVVLVPTMKVIVLLLLLFLSLAISVSCVITPPEKIVKVIGKNLGLPSLLFLIASIGFAFVISLFMGEGLTGYVGGRAPELGVSDPTITMGLMVIVDCVYLFVLWKIVKLLIDSLKVYLTSTFYNSVALVTGVGTSMVTGAMNKIKGGLGGAAGYAHGKKRHEELIEAMEGKGHGSSGKGFGSGSGGSSGGSGGSKPIRDTKKKDADTSNARDKDNDFKENVDDLSSNAADTSTSKSSEPKKPIEPERPEKSFPSRDNKADLKYINTEPVNHTKPVQQQSDSYREKMMRRSNAHNPAKPTKLGGYRRPVSDSSRTTGALGRADALRKASKMKEAMKSNPQNK